MNQIHRTALFTLTLTLVTLACSGPRPINVEQPQEPTAVQDTVKQDTVSQETVATVALDTVNLIVRDTLSQEEYNALMAALKPKLNTKQRQRKKAMAPSRQGYDYNNLEDYGWGESGVPIINIFPNYCIGLYGNVESVREATYTISEGNGIYFKQKSRECLYELNERGDFTRIIRSEPDQRNVILCKYDNYGNITYYKSDEKNHKRATEYKAEYKTEYKYDDEGRLISKTKTDLQSNEPSTENTIFQYDRNGKLIKELCYDGKDSLVGYTKYDRNGRILEMPCYYQYYYTTIIAKYKYKKKGAYTIQLQHCKDYGWIPVAKYDSQGKCVKEKYFRKFIDWYSLAKYSYDNKGNLVYYHHTPNNLEVHDFGDSPSDIHAKYDAYNRLITLNGSWWSAPVSLSNKYDARGNLILQDNDMDFVGYSSATAYKYDSQGNVVQKIEYNNEKKPVTVTEYNIVYRK